MNHDLPFRVYGASSEDFAFWQISALKSLLVRRNETLRNNEQCGKLFRSC